MTDIETINPQPTPKKASTLTAAKVIAAAAVALLLGAGIGYAVALPQIGAAQTEVSDLVDKLDRTQLALSGNADALEAAEAEIVELEAELAESTAAVEKLTTAETPSPVDGVDLTDEGRRDLFLVALTAIDPELTANADRALNRAANICEDIAAGKDEATLIANTEARYEGGTVPDLSADQARQIVEAARGYC